MTTTYAEVARVDDAWCRRVLLPETPFETVYDRLKLLTADTGTPITAFLVGDDGDPVGGLLLVRDPSRIYGTPEIATYESLAQRLSTKTDWQLAPASPPSNSILVGLGCREGYASDAIQHPPSEVEQHLAEHGTGWWTCRRARLVSARLISGPAVWWYDEVGTVVHASAEMAPTIERIAGQLAQHRFVVTDFGRRATRVLAAV